MPRGAESSGSARSAGTPATPRARRVGRSDTPMHHEEGTLATFRLSWVVLCQTFSMGPQSPEKLRNLAAMNQVPSFGS